MKSPETDVISTVCPFGFVSGATPWWLAVLFAMVVCLAGIPLTEVAANEQDQKTTNQAANIAGGNAASQLEALTAKAQAQGQVPVIVSLDVNFRAEGTLSGAAVTAQRNAISNAQKSVVQSLAGMNAINIKKYQYVPYLAVTVNATALQALARNPMVTGISEDIAVPPTLAESTGVVGADTAWEVGYDGNGWAVAVLDTGVDKNHNFLLGKVVSEACYSTTNTSSQSTSLCPGGVAASTATNSGLNCPLTTSGCAHGTHVAGIVAGKDYTPNGPGYNGVAKGANIIAIKVFSQFTGTTCTSSGETSPCVRAYISDLIHGLERVYALRTTFNIAAVNMSLGGGQYTSNCDTDPEKPIIDNLRAAGTATVIASGNSSYTTAIAAPACISTAISVGATCDSATAGFGCTAVDDVPSYSNIASFISLLAPGSLISSSTPGTNTYASWHGTSMAAPHVAGAWAVMKQHDPSATVSTILAAFRNTGTLVNDQRPSGTVTGMRRINVDLALGPRLPAPTFTYPLGGEILLAGTTTHITWNSNEPPAFNDDMESGASNWGISHGTGTLDWALGASNPHGGSYSWFASDPATISDQYLTSLGTVQVPVNGKLSFWHSYDTGLTHDGGVVEISTDGVNWSDLGPLMTQGGYNGTISTCCANPIGGRPAFTGTSGGYVETVVDLNGYAGQSVFIRFRMATDSSVAGVGWYVDDVKLFSSAALYELAYTDNCTLDIHAADDMENGAGLWNAAHGAGTQNWALGTSNPHGGAYSWFASDPETISDQYLTSVGALEVPADGKLSFWHSHDTESSYDGGVVEISTDGVNWSDLGPLMTQGDYNGTISTCCGNPVGGRPAFSGNSGGYVETVVDLGGYAGQSVVIRFRMATDSSVAVVGWYVDDVKLTGGTTAWTLIGTTPAGAGSVPWSIPATAGDDYCLRIHATSPGYLDSPLVTGAPFTVSADSDGDGLSNDAEINVIGTDPFSVDSDNDGLADGSGGLVPLAALPGGIDVNSDGFVDGEQEFGTSPINDDTDGDGVSDGDEISLYGIDPTVSNVGDVGPRGSPDNVINAGDLVVLTRLVTGAIQPTALESVLGDINGDGQVNVADMLLLERSIVFDTVP